MYSHTFLTIIKWNWPYVFMFIQKTQHPVRHQKNLWATQADAQSDVSDWESGQPGLLLGVVGQGKGWDILLGWSIMSDWKWFRFVYSYIHIFIECWTDTCDDVMMHIFIRTYICIYACISISWFHTRYYRYACNISYNVTNIFHVVCR